MNQLPQSQQTNDNILPSSLESQQGLQTIYSKDEFKQNQGCLFEEQKMMSLQLVLSLEVKVKKLQLYVMKCFSSIIQTIKDWTRSISNIQQQYTYNVDINFFIKPGYYNLIISNYLNQLEREIEYSSKTFNLPYIGINQNGSVPTPIKLIVVDLERSQQFTIETMRYISIQEALEYLNQEVYKDFEQRSLFHCEQILDPSQSFQEANIQNGAVLEIKLSSNTIYSPIDDE